MLVLSPAVSSRWLFFVKECSRIALLWLCGVVLFGSFRIFYLVYFHQHIAAELTSANLWQGFKTGFGFDSAASGLFFSIAFLANCILQPLRLSHWVVGFTRYSAYVFFSCAIVLCIFSITYIS